MSAKFPGGGGWGGGGGGGGAGSFLARKSRALKYPASEGIGLDKQKFSV